MRRLILTRIQPYGRPLLLLALVGFGLGLAAWATPEPAVLLEWGQAMAARPWLVIAVVALMAVLFTFALPGSTGLWLIAPFHPPVLSVALLLIGSVAGALGAHTLSRRLGGRWAPGSRGQRMVQLLRRRSDLLTQCALRTLPGFPHSVINYAAGMLSLSLGPFLLAAVIGLTFKWGVYTWVIQSAVAAIETGETLRPQTVLPLFVLAALLLLGALARRWFESPANDG
jgi:uncharacterized membrane protein YdjX (TVP38/TMEM64 family)